MNSPLPTDPLEAAGILTDEISGAGGTAGDITGLIRAIDAVIYSLHRIGPDIPYIEETEEEPPQSDYREIYEAIKLRYPNLRHYWLALHAIVEEGAEGELAVGDAIDDLADIVIALREVRWFSDHVDRRNALAALRARYDLHLWMHFHSLRPYLEEVKRYD